MRDDEVWLIHLDVIIEKDVDVDDAVMILTIHRLPYPTHLLFYLLGSLQELARSQHRIHQHTGIDEIIRRGEAPRLGFVKS